ncbi:MAG TPA: MFS transporter, partial [Caldithrix abyssi]|nr:MFS transporter [Caldithrix abyssi]
WGYAWPAYAAAFLNFLSLFSVFIWLPETSPRGAERAAAAGGNAFSWRALTTALRRPLVGPVLQVRFVFALSFSTFATVFAIYAEFGLGYSAQTTAYLLAYVGGLMVVVQSLLIAPLTVRFGEKRLLLYSIFLMTLSLIGWAFSRNLILLGLVLIPLALAGGVFNTVINSLLSKLVPEYEVGGMLGISASLESSTRIIAPSIGGYLMQNFGLSAPGVVSAAILLAVLPSAWRLFRERKRSPEE